MTPEKAIKLAVNDVMREILATRGDDTPDSLPVWKGMVSMARSDIKTYLYACAEML